MKIARLATLVLTGAITIGVITPPSAHAQRRVHFNIGGGPTFPLGNISERFEIGWGPEVAVESSLPPGVPTPTARKANGQYWPLTFGFRF